MHAAAFLDHRGMRRRASRRRVCGAATVFGVGGTAVTSVHVAFTLLGVGAMNSPRYQPAGLLVEHAGSRLLFDGGGETAAAVSLPVRWLVTDERAELMPRLRRQARSVGVAIGVSTAALGAISVVPRTVLHTSHQTYGYLISGPGMVAVWAPEFWQFPDWAAGADLLFADAAGWRSPIRFRGGVGGHAAALAVAGQAREAGVRRLVFAHLGRPTIRAIDAGQRPPFGEFGHDGQRFDLQLTAGADGPPGPPQPP